MPVKAAEAGAEIGRGVAYTLRSLDKVIMNLLSCRRMEKKVIQLPEVIAFARKMSAASQKQYYASLDVLESNGRLSAPRAEKVAGVDNLFAIRVMTRGNERFFYCYEDMDLIYVLHGYAKKQNKIPRAELNKALSIRKEYFGE